MLDVNWLNANGMNRNWRKNTILNREGHWFRVPIQAKTKQTARLDRSPNSKAIPLNPPPSNEIQASSGAKSKQTSRVTPVVPSPTSEAIPATSSEIAACAADCLIKFFDHVRLFTYRDRFIKERNLNPGIGRCIRIMRSMKNFGHQNKRVFDPLKSDLDNDVLYLFQICSVNVNTKDVDNSHAICVFNGLIYDANFDRPLIFSRMNLNRCCVGSDDWIFERISRCATFTPTRSFKSFMFRMLELQK